MAEALTRVGSWQEASAMWNEIFLSSGGRDVDAGLELSRCLVEVGNVEGARGHLLRLEAMAPERVDVALMLAQALEELGDTAGARARFGRAVSLEPDSAAALIGLARTDQGEAGAAALERARGSDATRPETAYALGLALAASGAMEDAVALLDQAIQAGVIDDEGCIGAARAVGPQSAILPWLRPVAARRPGDAEVLRMMGLAELGAGRVQAALATLAEAASSDPTDVAALIAYARAAQAAGRGERAEALLDRARALDPADDELRQIEELENVSEGGS